MTQTEAPEPAATGSGAATSVVSAAGQDRADLSPLATAPQLPPKDSGRELSDGIDIPATTTSGLILPDRAGRFILLREFEPAALRAVLLHVRVGRHRDRIDVVAWGRNQPSSWWLHRGVAKILGEAELSAAWWERRPARLVGTPAAWLAVRGQAAVILDWTAPVAELFGAVEAVECESTALRDRLWRTMIEQARPRLRVTARGSRDLAAA